MKNLLWFNRQSLGTFPLYFSYITFSGETENRGYISYCSYTGWEIPKFVDKLETQESQWYSSGPKPRKANGIKFQSESKSEGRRLMSLLKENHTERMNSPLLNILITLRPSLDWMRPTHTKENNLLSSVTDSNVNLIQKHPHRHTENNV